MSSFTLPIDLTDKTTGHFRIGPVSLAIPPDQIQFDKASNNDEILPLRSKYSYEIKTGQARWNLTIHWRALLGEGPNGTVDYSQWEDVRTIVAMVRALDMVASSFVDVRSILTKLDATMSSARIAFALKQLTVQTSTDIVDGLDCTLGMTLFNYLPYTPDFAFQGVGGDKSADGNNSPAFINYLNAWKAENLDQPYSQTQDTLVNENPRPWKTQNPDDMNLSYRKYYIQAGAPASVNPKQTVDTGDLMADLPVDHFTSFALQDGVTFRYLPNFVSMSGGQFETNATNLYVNQISVAFTNNMAVIPLADLQYPTFQHLGPAGSMISISLQQNGYDSAGFPAIANMLSTLEEQFLKMRTQWRKTSSIHRMQAIFVENQFLNMLGIFGMMDNQFTIQSVDESADISQGIFVTRQYENIYEALTPYRVKGPLGDTGPQFNAVFSSPTYTNLSSDAKNAIMPVSTFQTARAALDVDWLYTYMHGTTEIIPMLTTVPIPVPLLPAEKSLLMEIAGSMNNAISSYIPYYAGPAKTGQFSFADLIFLTNYPYKQEDVDAQGAMWNRIEALDAKNPPTSVSKLYDAIFKLRMNPANDPAFVAALNTMLESPAIKQTFLAADSAPQNNDHGAYRDLGLTGATRPPGDFSPAFYFADQTEEILMQASASLTALIAGNPNTVPPTAGLFDGNAVLNQVAGSSSAVVSTASELAIGPGNPSGILARTNLPKYSMKAAYPTFKLFLLEEDNLTAYHMLDDFYSYSSVIDIEVENHRERGSTAIIHLTNLAGVLSHVLFDGSIGGKQERKFYKWIPEAAANANDTSTGPAGLSTAVNLQSTYGLGNLQEGVDNSGRPALVPLRYFPLQSGSKIQVRMGFDDDPDKLVPVFNGIVTSVTGDEVLEIIAQGFQAELMKPAPDMNKDGWSAVSMVGNIWNQGSSLVADLFTGHPLDAWGDLKSLLSAQKGPAYGGLRIYGEGGSAVTVMESMLSAASAKHFGHWQVGQNPDQYLKGYVWTTTVGNWFDQSSTIGSLLKTAYDRSGENLLIDHVVNFDASHDETRLGRSFNFESPTMLTFGSPPQYYIPADVTVSPWQVIRDVSRRYPEYSLSVKNYGFPTQADGTLVFGQPLDWYYSRMPWFGETLGTNKVTSSDAPQFDAWWKSTGKARFVALMDLVDPDNIGIHGLFDTSELDSVNATTVEDRLTHLINRLNGSFDAKVAAVTGLGASSISEKRTALLQFQNEMRIMVSMAKDPTPTIRVTNGSDRIKPIRKFHYVDHRTIIHNGITVNDQFNNAVKLCGDVWKLNGMIPAHHQRVVNVDDQTIAGDKNIKANTAIAACYAQSFLRDEAGKMYQGEIVLSLIPEIEYGDILMIMDPSTGITGPVEVESVIHSFDQSNGAITIVRPRAWVMVNEATSANILAALWMTIPKLGALSRDFRASYDENSQLTKTTTEVVGTVASVGTLAGIYGATSAITGIVGSGAVDGLLAAAVFGGPPGWVIGGLVAGGLFVVGCAVAATVSQKNNAMIPMLVVPLSRAGHPWVGGLEGYRLADVANLINQSWNTWVTDELAPTLEGYRLLRAGISPFSQSAAAAAALPSKTGTVLSNLTRSSSVVQAWAQVIQQVEGFYPGSKSYRNNNPGNLEIAG